MDFYGINVTGDVSIELDSTYYIGDATHRFIEINAVTFEGTSTSAKWGDLAEKYVCKGEYKIGDVLCVSTDVEADVEICQTDLANNYVGVVSEKPGFIMSKQVDGPCVGLVGRLPVKVIGLVDKGDFLVPAMNGCARAGKDGEEAFKIGVAIETNHSDDEKLVECIIK